MLHPADSKTTISGARGDHGGPVDEEPAFRCVRCEAEYDGDAACPVCGCLPSPVPCLFHTGQLAHSRCVLCARTVCEAEASQLRAPALCTEHRGAPIIGDWAQVYTTSGEMEAQLVAENLRAEGIEAQVFSQSTRVFPVDLGELSIVRVLVPLWEYRSAAALIRSHMDTAGEVVFACPVCGSVYEQEASACASCGGSLTA